MWLPGADLKRSMKTSVVTLWFHLKSVSDNQGAFLTQVDLLTVA